MMSVDVSIHFKSIYSLEQVAQAFFKTNAWGGIQ